MPTQPAASVATATKSERLDKSIAALFAEISRSAAQRLIDQQRVQVNGAPRDASFRVNRGDVISVQLPDAEPALPQPESIALNVLYEDEDVIAINKPAGLVVHPAAGNTSGTIVNAMLAYSPNLSDVGDEHRPGIVHRLDKETSGVLLVAKTDAAYKALQAQFKARAIKKTYVALCVGRVEPNRGLINKPIARDPSHRQRMAVVAGGREAVTEYAVQEVFKVSGSRFQVPGSHQPANLQPATYSFVRIHPQTGRTHQIRVHFASLGFPLVGDALYGAVRRDALSKTLAPRQMLHASELSFEQPSSRKAIKLYAPIPEDMGGVIAELGEG
jgi:23S rRNA pseudouridine1911/1915/1917 synthase